MIIFHCGRLSNNLAISRLNFYPIDGDTVRTVTKWDNYCCLIPPYVPLIYVNLSTPSSCISAAPQASASPRELRTTRRGEWAASALWNSLFSTQFTLLTIGPFCSMAETPDNSIHFFTCLPFTRTLLEAVETSFQFV